MSGARVLKPLCDTCARPYNCKEKDFYTCPFFKEAKR